MKVLLLSAYAARSHCYWQSALLTMLDTWQWKVLSLPPRYFSWRVRGNALYWAKTERPVLEAGYDLLIATSMVDLATMRGLVPALAQVPTVVYFHENQFVYPQDRQQHSLLEAQVTSIYSALAADRILFNSRYNQDSFLAGCTALLRKLPDRVPPGVVSELQEKSSVLPVPVSLDSDGAVEAYWPTTSSSGTPRSVRLLWVGRFEHDKGGEGLLRILRRLEDSGLCYELAVTGQRFRQSPAVFHEIENSFAHRLVQFGFVEDVTRYRGLLQAADIVVSTAQHEFQGLAVMEAVTQNCLPVVPDRLVYPEIYPAWCCYDSCPDDPEREAMSAVALIMEMAKNLAAGEVNGPDLSAFGQCQLAPRYNAMFRRTAAAQDSH